MLSNLTYARDNGAAYMTTVVAGAAVASAELFVDGKSTPCAPPASRSPSEVLM